MFTMASNRNNNDAHNTKQKQKKIEGDDGDDCLFDNLLSLLLLAPEVPIFPTLYFGNILNEFPDLLFCVLPYIADRVVWNSIASSNKDMHDRSKEILPPWPLSYKLPSSDPYSIITWSPCGTRIAYVNTYYGSSIEIVDQRRGLVLNNWLAHDQDIITDLKYSPDGRFLVSIGGDKFLRLWDSTRNYEQIQEWDMGEELNVVAITTPKVSVSDCSKYIAASLGTCVILKNIEKGGNNTKSLLVPFAPNEEIYNSATRFSSDGRAVFICSNFECYANASIKVWRHSLDVDDEDRVTTLWRQVDSNRDTAFFFHHKTMVVTHNKMTNAGILWSIDTDHNVSYKEIRLDFQGSTGLHFTPDGNYIVVNKENRRPTLWSIAEGKVTNKTIHFLDNGSNSTKHVVKSFSPNNRQCIVVQAGSRNRSITSYLVK